MEAKELGEFIAANRKKKQITQADLAKMLNVTDKAVSRWERGLGFPDINTLEPLAEALGVTLTELMRCSCENDNNPDKEIKSNDDGIIASIEIAKNQRKQTNKRAIIGGAGCVAGICAILCVVGMFAGKNASEKNALDIIPDNNIEKSDTQVSLENPDEQSLAASDVKNMDETQAVDGWEVQVVDGWAVSDNIYYPYVVDRVKGVTYIEEMISGCYTDGDFVVNNRPEGCLSIIRSRSSFYASNMVQPEMADKSVRWMTKRNKLRYIVQGEQLNAVEQVDKPDICRYEIEKQDVQAVSCALYEDFFDEVPNMTIDVYGIPVKLWIDTFGSGMILSEDQYNNFMTRCDNNSFSQLDLLAHRAIDKTDVYYVDYNDLRGKGDYAQIIFVISFDERADYTFNINGSAMYEIYDDAAYTQWKEENIDRFIQ
ncbi:MAG: helix-turn-helix domain-containing protein [Lachnospira sp.]